MGLLGPLCAPGERGKGSPQPLSFPELPPCHTHTLLVVTTATWLEGKLGSVVHLHSRGPAAGVERAGGSDGGVPSLGKPEPEHHLQTPVPCDPEEAVRPAGLKNASVFLLLHKQTATNERRRSWRAVSKQLPQGRPGPNSVTRAQVFRDEQVVCC